MKVREQVTSTCPTYRGFRDRPEVSPGGLTPSEFFRPSDPRKVH
jgi:hypothetical protein